MLIYVLKDDSSNDEDGFVVMVIYGDCVLKLKDYYVVISYVDVFNKLMVSCVVVVWKFENF